MKLKRLSRKCKKAMPEIEEARKLAVAFGLTVHVNAVHTRRFQNTWHVIFCAKDGAQLLQWWPTNGKWWKPKTGDKGISKDAEFVVGLALDWE